MRVFYSFFTEEMSSFLLSSSSLFFFFFFFALSLGKKGQVFCFFPGKKGHWFFFCLMKETPSFLFFFSFFILYREERSNEGFSSLFLGRKVEWEFFFLIHGWMRVGMQWNIVKIYFFISLNLQYFYSRDSGTEFIFGINLFRKKKFILGKK